MHGIPSNEFQEMFPRMDQLNLNYSVAASRVLQHRAALQTARQQLQLAANQGFHSRLPLQRASQSLLEAIRLLPSDPEAYLRMAWLWYLLAVPEQALRYLDTALSLSEQHPEAEALRQLILEDTGQPVAVLEDLGFRRYLLSAPVAQGPVDLDSLAEEVAQLLQNQVHALMTVPPPQPVDLPADFTRLERTCQWLRQLCAGVQTRIQQIDQELDTHALQIRFRTLEQLCGRFERALDASWQIQQLQGEIQRLRDKVLTSLTLIREAESQAEFLPLLQAQLELLLDQQAQLADQLEPFRPPRISLPQLEADWKALELRMTALQEILDERGL